MPLVNGQEWWQADNENSEIRIFEHWFKAVFGFPILSIDVVKFVHFEFSFSLFSRFGGCEKS